MRHRRILKAALLASFAFSAAARATPIYLSLESRFPSGQHPRAWLEARTRDVQNQRWFQVTTNDKATGWIAEDHVITALKLTDQAELLRDTPARLERKLDAILGRPLLKKKARVLINEIIGSWARVQPLDDLTSANQSWIPTEELRAIADVNGPQRAYLPTTMPVRVQPDIRARALTKIPEGSYAHVISIKKDWVEVRTASTFGYLPRNEVVLATDLGDKGAHPAISLAPLRKEPLPYADLLRSLPRTQRLAISGEKSLRWGQVTIKDTGTFWWPINEEGDDEAKRANAGGATIKTAELFQRKIFDMAASKAIPSLKFASADGIYRTVDGDEWTKIPLFGDQNYPISVASTGVIFIGPYVSEDHGETFQQWIRWDELVSALKNKENDGSDDGKKLGILEIRPQDAPGRRVKLTLDLGHGKSVQVMTDDQGQSWRTL